jgi:surface-anchored protein
VAVGEAFWLLTQSPREGIPWFGASTEDVPPMFYDDDAVELVIVARDIPERGNLAAFSSGTFGAPSVIFATAAGKLTHSFRSGAHLHFNWAFTVEGTYDLSLAVVAHRAGVPEWSAPNHVRFQVRR